VLRVDDIQHMPWFDAVEPHSSFLLREGVRAFIAVPITDVTTKAISGIMYLDFRETQEFTEQDERWALFFAEQAGAAMHIVRAREATRSELERMREVLELYARLLEVAQEVLHQPDARVALLVRGWEHRPEQDPVEIRHQYFLVDGRLTHTVEYEVERGITGYAFRTNQDWRVDDVREPPWDRLYYPLYSPDTRSELDVLIQLGYHQAFGLLNVESPRAGAFTEEHHEQLRRLALIAALALDNRRRQKNLGILRELATAIITAVDVESTLRLVVDALRDLAPGAGAVTTWYRRPESAALLPGVWFGVRDSRRMVPDPLVKDSVLRRMLTSTKPILSVDAQHDPVLKYRFVVGEGIVASAAFPLRTPQDRDVAGDALDDEVVGILFINYRQLHVFTGEEEALFEAVAALAAAGIRDALRQTRLERERRSLATAMEITKAVGTTLDLDETLHTIMEQLRTLFGGTSPMLCVLNYDPNQHILTFAPVSKKFYPPAKLETITSLDVDTPRSIAGYVARRALELGDDVVENVPDVHLNPYYMEANPATRSELCIALMSPDTTLPAWQRLHGVLVVESEREHAFDDKVDFIRNVGQAIGIAIERARQSDRLRFSTTVANVTGWVDEIAHDIKTELRNINFSVHQLKQGARGDAQGYVREIDASIERLRSYLRAPRDVDKVAIPIDTWLRSQVEAFFEARGASIARTYDFHCAGLSVLVAPFVIERALKHLLRNAYEAMGKEGRLTVRTTPRAGEIEVQISNSGPAIPEYIRPKLFIEEVSGKREQRDGVDGGLGLLFVRLAIEGMGGHVYLVPTVPGEPVTFGFVLPQSVESPAA
jgi:GAF domain-containing protein